MKEQKKVNIPKFRSKELQVENFLPFEDGDFILICSKKNSILYDGKTLKAKQFLKFSSNNFYILTEKEFAILFYDKFEIYNFNEDKTSYTFIQSVIPNGIYTKQKIEKLLNGDILFYSYNLGSINNEVFRNNLYENQFKFLTHDLDGIIDLNKSEALGYKYNTSDEILIFKIFNNENYKVKNQNKIITMSKKTLKKRIYLKQPILIKIYENKIISFGGKNIYIFEIEYLELETTINLNKNIIKELIRPKGIIFYTTDRIYVDENDIRGIEKYYINNLMINYDNNELIEKSEKDITDELGEHKNIFEVFNYQKNGLAIINESKELLLYDNYYV